MSLLPDTLVSHTFLRPPTGRSAEHTQKQKKRLYLSCFLIAERIISRFKLQGKDTIPIQSVAKVPRLGTIGKNHIQSSFTFCIELFFLSALNLILS